MRSSASSGSRNRTRVLTWQDAAWPPFRLLQGTLLYARSPRNAALNDDPQGGVSNRHRCAVFGPSFRKSLDCSCHRLIPSPKRQPHVIIERPSRGHHRTGNDGQSLSHSRPGKLAGATLREACPERQSAGGWTPCPRGQVLTHELLKSRQRRADFGSTKFAGYESLPEKSDSGQLADNRRPEIVRCFHLS